MLSSRYYVLVPLFLLMGAITGFLLTYSKQPGWAVVLIFHLPPFLISLLSRSIFLRKKLFGYFHFLVCCLSLSFVIMISWFPLRSDLPFFLPFDFVETGTVLSALFTYVSFLIAVPVIIIPYFRSTHKLAENKGKSSYDLSFINQGFDNIRRNFKEAHDSITRETSNIDHIINEFQKNLHTQNEELVKLQISLNRTKEELEEYKALASLTKQQRDALLSVIGKQKYIDYLIGFILGVISSALVQVFPNIVQVLFK